MKRLYAIGIDFGTSNSCICQATYLRKDDGSVDPTPLKKPEAVPIQMHDTVPTAIFLGTADDPCVYGEVAEEKSLFYPELTKSGFKMKLGTPGQEGSEAYSLTRDFLAFLKEQIGNQVPFDAPASEVEIVTCVGHPVQWSTDQRDLTKRAALEAGFPNVSIEDESSAALYYHLCDESLNLRSDQDTRVLVIDMGGGTTDFAFVEIPSEAGSPPITTPVDPSRMVPAWDGKRQTYGGRDMDLLMARHLVEPLGFTRSSREWNFLVRETRRFKEQFSNALSEGKDGYRAHWMLEGTPREIRLDRAEFEAVAKLYINHLPKLIQGALTLSGVRAQQVDAVVLTGGHSRWYWVEEAVRSAFPGISIANKNLLRQRHPEQSVARGLAYRWMVEAFGGRPRPRRRAAHAIWIGSPDPTAQTVVAAPVGGSATKGGSSADPLLVMDRGQLLPFRTPQPARLSVHKMDFNTNQATLRLKVYTGSSNATRMELADRIATFDRPFWESMAKRIACHLPWSTSYDTDEFDVEVLCSVDEHELFTGKVTVTRFFKGKPSQRQITMLHMDPSVVPADELEPVPPGAVA